MGGMLENSVYDKIILLFLLAHHALRWMEALLRARSHGNQSLPMEVYRFARDIY